ncbi:hypothetical protein PRIPAC_82565 [Pristionchus pacificus]|uniref:Uncharacterized protein n=1 Tax=Pristionchus pacificus TaxID=54126 RepID=A0A2A6C280_PRIPA|nr:hypothetical protein PRIPAC_82565 [Pristionchus pacificus]|eukprot:PDM72219.1 hypothetical protein PRIPAC_38653 [Pristionchus pacificus]
MFRVFLLADDIIRQMTGAFFCMVMPVSLIFIFIMFDLRWFVPDAPSTFLRFVCLCLLVLDPTQFCFVYIIKTYGIYKARINAISLEMLNSDSEIDHGNDGSKIVWPNELFYE